jgi:predicted transcriptional regulator
MKNSKLFICSDCERIPAITAADNFMAIALFPKNAMFDRKYILCFDPGAIDWGKKLYDYYEQSAERIFEI